MTTKEQEKKALEQIRKIVSSLGEGSYIATAFEGCFEIAEDNIENDFACSMKQRAEHYMELYENIQDEYYTLKASADEESSKFEYRFGLAEEQIKKLQAASNAASKSCNEWIVERNKEYERAEKAEAEVEALRLEVMKLKASLYDYMTK